MSFNHMTVFSIKNLCVFAMGAIILTGCLDSGPDSDANESNMDRDADDTLAESASVTSTGVAVSDAAEMPEVESASFDATAAAVTDHTRTISVGVKGGTATAKWRDYGNGYIQLKSGTCWQGSNAFPSSCQYILRADGGKTTFHSWGPFSPEHAFVNGSYTIAKSRHPYVKVIVRSTMFGTSNGYIHLY
jgi:hypothetical protein